MKNRQSPLLLKRKVACLFICPQTPAREVWSGHRGMQHPNREGLHPHISDGKACPCPQLPVASLLGAASCPLRQPIHPGPQRSASGVWVPVLLEPHRHLSELGDGDTVIIHGLKAHSRHWKMNYVSFISKKQSQSPFVIKFAVRETLLYLITSDISWLLVLETIKV